MMERRSMRVLLLVYTVLITLLWGEASGSVSRHTPPVPEVPPCVLSVDSLLRLPLDTLCSYDTLWLEVTTDSVCVRMKVESWK